MEIFDWIWAFGGLLVGAGAMYGWLQWYKPQVLPILASRTTKAKMSPEAVKALEKGDPPTDIKIKVGDKVIYRGPMKKGKTIYRRLKFEGKDPRLIDEYGRDRG